MNGKSIYSLLSVSVLTVSSSSLIPIKIWMDYILNILPNYEIKEIYNLTAIQQYSTTASGSVGFWLDGLCHLMTCGQQDWEPTSKQITVKAFQTNACKWENLLCFISHYIHERPSKYKSNWKQLDFYETSLNDDSEQTINNQLRN